MALFSSAQLKQTAAELGFSACGIAQAAPLSATRQAERRAWLAEGYQADMLYLEQHTDKRFDPRLLLEGACTVVSLAVNYYPGSWDELARELAGTIDAHDTDEKAGINDEKADFTDEKAENVAFHQPNAWHLARYAYGTDYHEVVKSMLRSLAQAMGWTTETEVRCFVDTAPIDEKYWAEQSGIGWRGRHSQLIVPHAGSYFFLGELLIVHEADHYDQPHSPQCPPHCRRCIDACPTSALRGDGTLDARRCLSYLSIEHRGPLPPEAAQKMSPCIYGCDRCAEACPFNRMARRTTIDALRPRPSLLAMTPEGWINLSVEQYRELFRKSAVKRAKFEGITRNIQAVAQTHLRSEAAERDSGSVAKACGKT